MPLVVSNPFSSGIQYRWGTTHRDNVRRGTSETNGRCPALPSVEHVQTFDNLFQLRLIMDSVPAPTTPIVQLANELVCESLQGAFH
jgi:hypothetical protein